MIASGREWPEMPVQVKAVSYTHLDVYKRQAFRGPVPRAGVAVWFFIQLLRL